MAESSICEMCNNYIYDDEEECYVCDMDLDEDDMYRFLTCSTRECPYYTSNNEYEVVRHQAF